MACRMQCAVSVFFVSERSSVTRLMFYSECFFITQRNIEMYEYKSYTESHKVLIYNKLDRFGVGFNNNCIVSSSVRVLCIQPYIRYNYMTS